MINQRKVLIEKIDLNNPLYEAMDDLFIEILCDCYIVKLDEYPDSLFYKKNDKTIMEQDLKNKDFWFHYNGIWSVFESSFDLNYQQTQDFLRSMLEVHLNLRGYTPESFTLHKP